MIKKHLETDPQQSGVSLPELLLVIVMIGIIAAFFIANLTGSEAAANETAAVATLKTMIVAQRGCQNLQKTESKGYCTLNDLVAHRLLDQSYADASTIRKGYQFTIKTHGDRNQFFDCLAVPSEPGKTGNRAFAATEQGVVYASDKGIYKAPAINSSTRAISGGNPVN